MTRVPRFLSLRLPLRKLGLGANCLRPLGLLVILSLASVFASPSGVQAQTTAKTNQEMEVFTIVEAPDGSSLCRDATVEERQRAAEARAQSSFKNLRLINHIGELERLSDGGSADVNDGSLPGLKIFLLATARLDANPAARAAFIKAASNWEQVIKTPMTVYIRVDVGPDFFSDGKTYSSRTIGSTSSFRTSRNFSDVRTRLINTASNANETALYNLLPTLGSVPTDSGDATSVSVSLSIARALGILPANATQNDPNIPQIGFNSAFNFDYDQSDNITTGLVDFTAVATHEIGHALGFSSESGAGSSPPQPAILDLFRFRPGVANFTTAQRIMTTGGSQIFFAGAVNIFTNGSPEAGLSTGGPNGDGPGGDGQQSSHWRDDTPAQGGFHVGIMDPTIASGRLEVMTANDLAAFNYMGYNLENSTLPPQPAAPANDNFAAAQVISGCSGTVNDSNANATKEAGEPSHSPDNNGGGASVWYQWQAPSTGSVTMTTAGSNYDTLLAVYTGNSVAGLTLLQRNDDVVRGTVVTSTVTFNATAGTIYRIAVDGYDANTGNLTLNWNAANCGVVTPPSVQFSQASYAVNEAAGFATITINRAGDTSSPATVRYATSDTTDANFRCDQATGVASRKCDYHIAAGKLRFAPGETTKQLTLSIIDDVFVEGAETLTLTLSNPTGATLGQNSIVPVTIADNDSAAGAPNPIDQTGFYIRQLYVDLLSREPDPAGLSGWTSRINLCGQAGQAPPPCDRVTVGGDGFLRSGEFFDRQFFVLRLYRTGLGRILRYDEIADLAYVSGFLSDADLELNKQDLAADIMARPEFAARYNGLDNTQFVDTLLQTAGVIVPADVRVAWITALTAGSKPRAQVYREISERPEVSNVYAREAQVVSAYYGFFTRNPDGAYLVYLDRLNRGEITLGDLANAFINAAEYRSRFGQ